LGKREDMLLSVGVKGHSLSEDTTEVEICLDQEGLQFLTERLNSLKKEEDLLHFFSPQWGGDELRSSHVVQEEDMVVSHHLCIALIEMKNVGDRNKEKETLLSVEVRGHSPSEDTTEVEIYLDRESLQLIIEDFRSLKERGDHLHYFSPQWGGYELTGQVVREGNAVASHLRVTLIEERDMENKDQL
jgi:hypothetical protein